MSPSHAEAHCRAGASVPIPPRRIFLGALASSASWRNATAREGAGGGRIGYLFSSPQSAVKPLVLSFEQVLTTLGHRLGRDTSIEYRFDIHSPALLRESARELGQRNDVLVVSGTIVAIAARDVGVRCPVVFAPVGFPVALGFAQTLRRPGGNFTGISFEAAEDTYAKRLQLLKEIDPQITRVAALGDADDLNIEPSLETLHRLAPSMKIEVIDFMFRGESDLATAFANMPVKQIHGVVVIAGALAYRNSASLSKLAMQYRLPSIHGFKEAVASGGLMSLGPDLAAIAGQAARYVHLILRGTVAAEIPVEQPSRYEFGLNIKTARALGLSVPSSLLARADFIVE